MVAALSYASSDVLSPPDFAGSIDLAQPYDPAPRMSREGDRTVVWLDGEHDITTVWPLADALATAMVLDADLVLDMSGVEFMGAATLGVLLRGQTLQQARARLLTVRSPSRCVLRIINICGLTELIDREPAGSDVIPVRPAFRT